jgi:hypothetical protein
MQASHGDAGGSMLFRRGRWILSSYTARSIHKPFWFATQEILDRKNIGDDDDKNRDEC